MPSSGATTSARFTRARRVRRRAEFQRVFELGIRIHGRYLTLLMVPNNAGTARLGIVASRKLGDAPSRNRAKRLIREVFRKIPPLAGVPSVDVVVIPRRELFDAEYLALEKDFRSAYQRCAARLPVTIRA
jgi:ribonuclease P protein component